MRALAELYARRGIPVSGCDAHPESAAELEHFGIDVKQGSFTRSPRRRLAGHRHLGDGEGSS